MSNANSLNQMARQLMRKEWATACEGSGPAFPLPEDRFLDDLVALAASEPAKQIKDFEGTIHRMVMETHFVNDSGDSMILDDMFEEVDAQVKAIVRVLERVRRHALNSGQWSAAPVSPPMFG